MMRVATAEWQQLTRLQFSHPNPKISSQFTPTGKRIDSVPLLLKILKKKKRVMGNICSISFPCDAIFSRCLDCTTRKAAYVSELESNLAALLREVQKLTEAKNDVMRRVIVAEQRRMKRTDKVQGWVSRVDAMEIEVRDLTRESSQEIERLCLGGYCSKNCKLSYKFGKNVAKKLQALATLMGEGAFEVVAEMSPESVAEERTTKFKANLAALQTELQKLIEAKSDVLRRVTAAEKRHMKRTDQVEGWLSRVQAVETEVGELLIRDGSQEIEKSCTGGFSSENCTSSYELGKFVAKKQQVVATLMGEGVKFDVLAERTPEPVADERPTEPTVVGLQSILEQVWRCILEEPAGIIGLYGMGGVGKTTLLTLVKNKFVKSQTDFDYVIWVVVSKDLRLEKIQEIIGKKIDLIDDSWNDKSVEDKALDIFKALKEKKFVLLLDDLWDRVDLTKVGVPLSSPQNTASKVVFTTRFIDVCGSMEAHRKFKVECLSDGEAWELFQKKVGEETVNSRPDILELARSVANECGGLPLVLVTIGRAMSYKNTPEEWRYAVEVLRRSASEFVGLGKEVYPLLKFSFDSLPNDIIRSCFLYCCLYQEDCSIYKRDLIDCWICEGFLEEPDRFGAQNQGYYIVGTLVYACLLEEVEDDRVKMHDVIRDMALWIACEIEKENNFLVYAGLGLTEAPDVRGWEKVRRLSLMGNEIENLSDIPKCPHLHTLFLNNNNLRMITDDFFQFMPSLKVLKLSQNESLHTLPTGISRLVSLRFLDISVTNIKELPKELKALVNMTCLNLEGEKLITIPRKLISSFSRLRVLRMAGVYYELFDDEAFEDKVLIDVGEFLTEELLVLKYLQVLDFTLSTSHALHYFLSSHKFRSCTQTLFLHHLKDLKLIYASSLADLKHLHSLCLEDCAELEELKIIDFAWGLQEKRQQPCVFHSLHGVAISSCPVLKDLTFLVFAPNLKGLWVDGCNAMEEIISAQKFHEIPEMMGNAYPFAKLKNLYLSDLHNLKSIYTKSKQLSFTRLEEIIVRDCFSLKKLPFDSNNSAKEESKIVIRGEEGWWEELQWEDEATQIAFRSCFRKLV